MLKSEVRTIGGRSGTSLRGGKSRPGGTVLLKGLCPSHGSVMFFALLATKISNPKFLISALNYLGVTGLINLGN